MTVLGVVIFTCKSFIKLTLDVNRRHLYKSGDFDEKEESDMVNLKKNFHGLGKWEGKNVCQNSPFSMLNAFLDTSPNSRVKLNTTPSNLLSPKNGAVLLSKIQSYF